MARSRNPLALALLVTLSERPMHPYEVATTLRQRQKQRSVKLNYGSLYAVVDSLVKQGLIEPQGTHREGRLPERTVYELTDAGRLEVHEWLSELVSTPQTEYMQFGAALAFLASLPPDEVLRLLKQRLQSLAFEDAQAAATREVVEKAGMPRLLWLDDEYRRFLREAETQFVEGLVREIERGGPDGAAWWKSVHENGFAATQPPFDPDALHDARRPGADR